MRTFSIAVAVALAVSASAEPIRILPDADVTPDIWNSPKTGPQPWIEVVQAERKPCAQHRQQKSEGRFAALLARLGFAPPTRDVPSFFHDRHYVPEMKEYYTPILWAGHIDKPDLSQVKATAQEAPARILPVLEGGSVKILPVMENGEQMRDGPEHSHDRWISDEERINEWEKLEGKDGIRVHRHRGHRGGWYHDRHMGRSFGCRIHRALRALRPVESLALAFVLGAGIGSILHFTFMIFLLGLRLFRCKNLSREERRARRKARREAREARKGRKRCCHGRVKLDGEEGEALPAYIAEEKV